MAESDSPLLPDRRRLLLDLARATVELWVREGRRPVPPQPLPPPLGEPRGVFVTLRRRGELRGCIGYPLPSQPLAAAVIDCAVSAASADPRFAPVSRAELADLALELSVLSLPRAAAADALAIGRHGVIVSRDGRRGLLLPQVAVEQGWDRQQLLEHACLKAGLEAQAWRQGATIELFTAEVFADPAEW